MGDRVKLFVVDTGPLITLAAAKSLDYLLYVEGAKVVLPDAVFYEATRDALKLGAADILDWVKENHRSIEIAPTNAFLIFQAASKASAGIRQPNLGEQAAVEAIEEPGQLETGERAVLLCEESAVLKRITVRDTSRIIELSTMDFLLILERERRIQSADAVFQNAIEAGRTPSKTEHLGRHEEAVREAVAGLIRPRRDAVP